jgi:hypothetical protein
MNEQNSKGILPVILAVIITAVAVGGGMYWWQSSQTPVPTIEDETKTVEESSAEPETEADYALSVNQDTAGASVITVRDTFNEGAGFSLQFPSSWGFVSVKKSNLTDCGFGCNPPQRASYTFTSEFSGNHYFEVIISYANEKEDPLVTQGNRIYIAEDATYYYNYSPSTEVDGINAEIQEIIASFELLSK